MCGNCSRLSPRAPRGQGNRGTEPGAFRKQSQDLGARRAECAVPRAVFRKWRRRKSCWLVGEPVLARDGASPAIGARPPEHLLSVKQIAERGDRARITRSAPFALAAISLKPIRSLASAGVASSSPRAGRVASAADPIRAEPQPAPGNRLSRTSPVWGCSQCVECPALCANCFPRNARAESNPGAACFRLIGCRRRRFAFGHLMGTRGRTRSSNPSWVARHTSRRGATCGLRCFHSPQYLGATPDAKWVPLADALRTWLLAPAPEVLETPECFRSSQRAGSASDGLLVTVVPRVRLPTGGLPWTSNHLPPR